MAKFKVGDKVVCRNYHVACGVLKLGGVYEIVSVAPSPRDNLVCVKELDGSSTRLEKMQWSDDRFSLAKEEEPEAESPRAGGCVQEIRAGDYVVCVNEYLSRARFIRNGEIYRVIHVVGDYVAILEDLKDAAEYKEATFFKKERFERLTVEEIAQTTARRVWKKQDGTVVKSEQI
jgi:predicted RNA-binding protein with PUA-like domain